MEIIQLAMMAHRQAQGPVRVRNTPQGPGGPCMLKRMHCLSRLRDAIAIFVIDSIKSLPCYSCEVKNLVSHQRVTHQIT
jgi:hypothetical protein